MSAPEALICGFSDEAGGLAGLAWTLGAGGGMVFADGSAHAGTCAVEAGGDAATVKIDAGEHRLEADLMVAAEASPAGSPAGDPSIALCTAAMDGGGRGEGHLTRWEREPAANGALLRHLAIPAADGSLLIVMASGRDGGPHSEETAAAWLLKPDGEVTPYPEALLSTEYDASNLPARAGLELWSEDPEAPPLRAAGTRLGDAAAGEVSAALLRSSAEGAEGVGSYLLRRG